MPAYVKDGGTWRTPHSIFAKVSGTWERVNQVYTRVAGVWTSVFEDQFNLVISSNQNNVDLRNFCLAAGWNGIAQANVTISPGVVLSGSGASGALYIAGSFPGGLSITNSGSIVGVGGVGGAGGAGRGDQGSIIDDFGRTGGIAYSGSGGGAGSTALYVSGTPVTFTNLGVIAGGGGGGGGGAGTVANQLIVAVNEKTSITTATLRRQAAAGGGGGGGGRSSGFNSSGGAFGIRVRGSTASIGNIDILRDAVAGAGGDINNSGGGGFRGEERDPGDVHAQGGDGGAGGFFGASGSAGGGSSYAFPSANSRTAAGGAGGAGGLAVFGDSNITWAATGTRYGGIA